MKHLIFGATGFIGSHLAERLALQGGEVYGFCRPDSPAVGDLRNLGVRTVLGDLRDEESVRRAVAGMDNVFNCAGVIDAGPDLRLYQMVNALAVNTILLACRGLHVNRIVHVSCALVHGLQPDGRPADEGAAFQPETPYAASKAEGERVAQAYAGQPDLHVTILRPVTPLGGRDCRTADVLMTAYRQPGRIGAAEGEQPSSFVDARDVARAAAFVAADDRAINRTYIVRGFDATLAELLGALFAEPDAAAAPPSSHAGRTRLKGWPRVRPRPEPGLPPAMADALLRPRTFDDSRIRRELGFQPEFDLRATAEAMAASYWEREIQRLREPA